MDMFVCMGLIFIIKEYYYVGRSCKQKKIQQMVYYCGRIFSDCVLFISFSLISYVFVVVVASCNCNLWRFKSTTAQRIISFQTIHVHQRDATDDLVHILVLFFYLFSSLNRTSV